MPCAEQLTVLIPQHAFPQRRVEKERRREEDIHRRDKENRFQQMMTTFTTLFTPIECFNTCNCYESPSSTKSSNTTASCGDKDGTTMLLWLLC